MHSVRNRLHIKYYFNRAMEFANVSQPLSLPRVPDVIYFSRNTPSRPNIRNCIFFHFKKTIWRQVLGFQSTCSRFHPFGIDFILSLWAIGIRYWSTAISDGKKIYIAPGNDLLLYSYMHWLWWQKSDKESIFTYTSVWKQMVYN